MSSIITSVANAATLAAAFIGFYRTYKIIGAVNSSKAYRGKVQLKFWVLFGGLSSISNIIPSLILIRTILVILMSLPGNIKDDFSGPSITETIFSRAAIPMLRIFEERLLPSISELRHNGQRAIAMGVFELQSTMGRHAYSDSRLKLLPFTELLQLESHYSSLLMSLKQEERRRTTSELTDYKSHLDRVTHLGNSVMNSLSSNSLKVADVSTKNISSSGCCSTGISPSKVGNKKSVLDSWLSWLGGSTGDSTTNQDISAKHSGSNDGSYEILENFETPKPKVRFRKNRRLRETIGVFRRGGIK